MKEGQRRALDIICIDSYNETVYTHHRRSNRLNYIYLHMAVETVNITREAGEGGKGFQALRRGWLAPLHEASP